MVGGGQQALAKKPLLPPLDTGPLPLAPIRDAARKQLIDVIDSRRGRKALFLDPALSGPLTLLDASLGEALAEHGVARMAYFSSAPLAPGGGGAGASSSSLSSSSSSFACPPPPLTDPIYDSGDPPMSSLPTVFYVLRATLANARALAAHVKAGGAAARRLSRPSAAGATAAATTTTATTTTTTERALVAVWVPRRSVACERVLEDEGVSMSLDDSLELPLDAVPLDDDVLALAGGPGGDAPLRGALLEGDPGPLLHAALVLSRLQSLFGAASRVQGVGPAAAAVRELLARARAEAPFPPAGGGPASALGSGGDGGSGGGGGGAPARIDRIILLDREVDLVTPLLTQITFEGLVDEVIGVTHGAATLPAAGGGGGGGAAAAVSAGGACGSSSPGGAGGGGGAAGAGGVTVLLNSSDPFFRELRDLPYYVASQRLQQYAREARAEYASLGEKDLLQLKMFVKGLPKLAVLDRLTDLAVPVADVVRRQPFHDRLRCEADAVEGYGGAVEAGAALAAGLARRGDALASALRLLCLLSLTHGGVPRRQLDAARHELLAEHGPAHLLTLAALERAGLLRAHGAAPAGGPPGAATGGPALPAGGQAASGRGQFARLRAALKLVVREDDAAAAAAEGGTGGGSDPDLAAAAFSPGDVSHLHRGYAPISIRLVESALGLGPFAPRGAAAAAGQGGGAGAAAASAAAWGASGGPVAEALALLPGPHFDVAQVHDPGTGAVVERAWGPVAAAAAAAAVQQQQQGQGHQAGGGLRPPPQETVLVAFLGGCTATEISALRWLSSRPGARHRFCVLTSRVLTGSGLVGEFADPSAARWESGVVGGGAESSGAAAV